jgi:hypothetical protein
MKKVIYAFLCLMFAGLTNATAAIDRFAATSPTYGVLGYMDFDSSTFDALSVQFIDNTSMLGLDFTNPLNSFHITTIGPAGFGTYFDSTGALPSVLAGYGLQGGTDISDEVAIVTGAGGFGDPSYLILGNGSGNDLFSEVGWSASVVAAVPEPETYTMLLAGLGLMVFVARRRKQSMAA